jgi:uncharacterized protein YggE
MFKNLSYLLIIISLFAVVGVGVIGVYTYSRNTQILSSLPISEKLSKKIKPESAKITLHIRLTGNNLEKMNAEITDKTNSIQEYLVSSGVDRNKIKTNITSYPDYSYYGYPAVEKPDKINSTVLDKSIEVTFDKISQDPTKPNNVLNETIKRGVTQFDSFVYDIGNIEDVCSDLKNQVELKIQETAEKKINAIKGKLVKIESQGTNSVGCDNNGYPIAPYYSAKDASLSSSEPVRSAPELLTGETEITVYSNSVAFYNLK